MRASALFRLSLLLLLSLAGCSLFRANPLEQRRGAVVLLFDTRTAGDLKSLRKELSDHGAKATFFVSGRIQRGLANMLYDLRAEGHEIGLSGLKGMDPQMYSSIYGRQKYFQDEIVTQVLDAERENLNPRYCLLRYPGKMKAEALALPSFLVSKGFARVVDLMPDYMLPKPVSASELSSPVVHAYQMKANGFNRAQIASLAQRNRILVVSPDRKILPDLLAEAHAQGVPFATVSDLKEVK